MSKDEGNLQNTYPLTSADFDTNMNVKPSANIVVLFFRDGCGHCTHFKPVYMEFAKQVNEGLLGPNFKVASVNTGRQQELMQRLNSGNEYNVNGVPMVVSYSGNKYFSTYEPGNNGSHPYRSVEDLIDYTKGIGSSQVTYN